MTALITQILDWLTTSDEWRAGRIYRPSKLGLAVLEAIELEDGLGEEGGNNRGPHIKRWGGKQGKSWCGAVVYACLLVGCAKLKREPPFARSNGARQLFRRAVKAGMLVDMEHLQPGDWVLWDRGDPGRPETAWQAHIGIVSRVVRDGFGRVSGFYYFAGNEGSRAVVKERLGTHRPRLHGFARLP